MRKITALFACVTILTATPALAWNGTGHMLVAYIAYQNLNPAKVRPRVDALLKLHPMYATWTQGVADGQKGVVAFVNAATWPDCIKQAAKCPGYNADGTNNGETPPSGPEASQNIGFADKSMHKYWHYVDEPFSAGAPGDPAQAPNVETQIVLFTTALSPTDPNKTKNAALDKVKSFDIAWLEHLVGDIHQPLHATTRFTKKHPGGDTGGNDVKFSKDRGDELHAYWDDLLGTSTTITFVTNKGKKLNNLGKPGGAAVADPAQWKADSFALAKSAVYIAPISDESDPKQAFSPKPDPPYHDAAVKIAEMQVRLAGYRLANLLNSNLK